MNTLPVLIRREFWEHRVLWMAPLAVAVLYIVACMIPGGLHVGGLDLGEASAKGSPERPLVVFAAMQIIFILLLFALMSVVAFFYLSDCLYAERKDRSILFWKSLPVSDAATVLSKLLVAMLVLPLGVYLLGAVTNVVVYWILYARFHDNVLVQTFVHWDTGVWLRLNMYLVIDVLLLSLWYAPLAAYQLLISAWAKSSVFVWTILPPLALVLGERLLFGTWRLAKLIGDRLGTGWGNAGAGYGAALDSHGPEGLGRVFRAVNMTPLLATPDLWIGVGIAAVLIFGAIRIRRYRDDS